MGGGGFLGLGPAPSAPAAPDYSAAARETAAGNLDAARAATAANRVNQVTPYGNLDYKQTGTDQYGNPTWTATTSLSDVGQQLLSNQNRTSLGLGSAINAQLGQVQDVMGQGFNPQTAPITTNVGQANLQTTPDYQGGMAGWDRANQLLMQRLQPQMDIQQKTLDAKLANQGVVAGTEAYNRAKMGLGMQQNDLLNQAQLQAQGIGQNLFNQALQGGQFTNQALLGQNQAQLSNTGLNNQAIAQNFGQNLSAQQLQNQAAQQNYANLLAGTQLGNQAGQQNYANLLAGQGFNNQAAQQQYQNQLAAQAANNPALQQMYANQQQQQQSNNAIAQQQFANQMQNANLANQARQQGFGELSYMRNEPLNTLNAVRSGSQVQGANFVNPANQATTTGADYLSAAQAQGQYNMAGYNAQQAAQASANQGLMGLGGTLGAAAILSDIRTKENIKAIGWLPNGLPVYEYEYKPEFKAEAGYGKHIGVMAQEVEQVVPEAIITRADGYKMVDYAKL